MTSFIDPSVPIFGSPTTESVRHNFLIAKQEIEALQSAVGLTVPVSVTHGGTGAASTVDALENLGGVARAGSTMTGLLVLSGNPTNLLGAATKLYVDNYFPVSIANGGTGTNNETDALANLGGAPLASPIFTGIPSAPTAPVSDASTILATTEFVHNAINAIPSGASSIAVGTGLTRSVAGSTVTISLEVPVSIANGGTGAATAPAALTSLGAAPIVSPTFTGLPNAPTVAAASSSTTQIATTAFVQNAINARGYGTVNGVVAGQGLTGGGSTGNVTVSLQVPVTVSNGGTGTTVLGNNAVLVGSGPNPIRAGLMTLDSAGNLHVFGTATFDNPVTLNADPMVPLGAATKQYVDSHIGGITNITGGIGIGVGGTGDTRMVSLQVPVTVANGGTGATTTAGALTSLGAASTASPTFTGTPRAPTATAGDSSTVIATTAFVQSAMSTMGDITGVLAGTGLIGGGTTGDVTIGLATPVSVANGGTGATSSGAALTALGAAPINSPAFVGTPSAPTPTLTDNTMTIATTAFVKGQGYAPLASPTFSGTPSGPTATAGTSTTQLATTAFVTGAVANYVPLGGGVMTGLLTLSAAPTAPLGAATKQYVDGAFTGYAPLASPTFTGDPKAPTPLTADNDTSIATTAFVKSQNYLTSPVSLVTQVTDALPVANGGTGATTGAVGPYLPLVGGSITGTPGALGIGVSMPGDIAAGNVYINGTITTAGGSALFNNAYNATAGGKIISTGPAAAYNMGGGFHAWYTAPSGAAGSAPSWTQRMTLDGSGNLQIINGYLWVPSSYITVGAGGTTGHIYIKNTSGSTQLDIYDDGNSHIESNTQLWINSNSKPVFIGAELRVGTNSASSIYVNGYRAMYADSGYVQIFNPQGSQGIYLNNGVNYYRCNGTHYFQNLAGSGNANIQCNMVQGGPGNSGTLQCWNTGDYVNFHWNGNLYYRINETTENLIVRSDVVTSLFHSSGWGGPTNWVMLTYRTDGSWMASFVDSVSSDERIKQNIAPTRIDALAALNAIQVSEFEYRPEIAPYLTTADDTKERTAALAKPKPVHVPIGFVAQHVEPHIPEAAFVPPIAQDDPFPADGRVVVQQNMIPYLVRAVQQLLMRLAVVEAKI